MCHSRRVVAPAIEPSVIRVDPDGSVTLLGGWSPTSGHRHFPLMEVCPYSGADDVQPLDLPRRGKVWLHTTVGAPPPGYTGPAPYGLGVVELEGHPLLRVVARLIGAVEVGTPVSLRGEEIPGPDGLPVTTWAFASGGPE